MRLIDADALDYELGSSDRDIYVRECLQDAPTVILEPHWIPVTERLPEKEGRYLVTNSKIGAWIIDIDFYRPYMPLPEPYQHDAK